MYQILTRSYLFNAIGIGVMDSMMEVLESYANHLEEKVTERTIELDAAHRNLQNLLHQVNTRHLEQCIFARILSTIIQETLNSNDVPRFI